MVESNIESSHNYHNTGTPVGNNRNERSYREPCSTCARKLKTVYALPRWMRLRHLKVGTYLSFMKASNSTVSLDGSVGCDSCQIA